MSRVMLLINAHAQSRKLAFLIVLAFSGGRTITIQKRKVWTRFSRQGRKNIRFQTKTVTCGRGLSAITRTKYRRKAFCGF